MFEREYAARDRRKPRGRIAKEHMMDLARYRYAKQAPLADVGFDAVDIGLIDDLLDEHIRTHIPSELWLRYTTVTPFCIAPQGGTDPKKLRGVRPKNPIRKPTELAAEASLVKMFSQEAQSKRKDELPAEPTWAEQVAKAGGKTITVPQSAVAEWHELDA